MAFSWSSKPTSWISLAAANKQVRHAHLSVKFAASRPGSATPVRPGRQTPHDGAQLIESRPCSEPCRRSVILKNGFEGGFVPDDAEHRMSQAFSLH